MHQGRIDRRAPIEESVAPCSVCHEALSACSQAGLVNNLNDGLAWGLFPIFFAKGGLSVGRIGSLAVVSLEVAIYTVAALTAASGFVVIARMYEPHPPSAR